MMYRLRLVPIYTGSFILSPRASEQLVPPRFRLVSIGHTRTQANLFPLWRFLSNNS